jgi:hypothetical protein
MLPVEYLVQSLFTSLFYVIDTGSTGSRARTWGLPVYLSPRSDAGCAYAYLRLTLQGAPVNIGEGHGLFAVAKTENLGALPVEDRMWLFGIIGVATRYILEFQLESLGNWLES